MSDGLRGLLATLRRLLGGQPARKEGGAGAESAPHGQTGPGIAVPQGDAWQLPERPAAKVLWKKDLWGLAPAPRTAARERTIQRQRLLVLLALLTIGAVGAVYGLRFTGDRTLPMSVRGVWRTDGPNYAQRLFELSGTRLAFQTSESTSTIHQISRVRRMGGEAGITYLVEYQQLGDTYEFSFVHSAGPPEEIRFTHQPFMVWTRTADRRRLLPELFD